MHRKIICMFALFAGCASHANEGSASGLQDDLDAGFSIPPPLEEDSGKKPDEVLDPHPQHSSFMLASPALSQGGTFAIDYTCEGKDVSPALSWSSPPEGTKSYVLVLSDLDAQVHGEQGPFVHWALFNIPQALHALPENIGKGAMPMTVPGASQVRAWSAFGGALGGNHYFGPCPHELHHYAFTLYALGSETLEGIDTNKQPREVLLAAMRSPALLDQATLMGVYEPLP